MCTHKYARVCVSECVYACVRARLGRCVHAFPLPFSSQAIVQQWGTAVCEIQVWEFSDFLLMEDTNWVFLHKEKKRINRLRKKSFSLAVSTCKEKKKKVPGDYPSFRRICFGQLPWLKYSTPPAVGTTSTHTHKTHTHTAHTHTHTQHTHTTHTHNAHTTHTHTHSHTHSHTHTSVSMHGYTHIATHRCGGCEKNSAVQFFCLCCASLWYTSFLSLEILPSSNLSVSVFSSVSLVLA